MGEKSKSKMKHPLDMNANELREVLSAMAWLCLDLAQHLMFTIYMLKKEYVKDALDAATEMAFQLSEYPYSEDRINPDAKTTLAIFGKKGLTVERFDEISDIFSED